MKAEMQTIKDQNASLSTKIADMQAAATRHSPAPERKTISPADQPAPGPQRRHAPTTGTRSCRSATSTRCWRRFQPRPRQKMG